MPVGPILVVDDEPANLAAMRQVIGDQYAMVFALDGQGAIEAARKHGPALILLDIQMPNMDGYEVCRRLKADPRRTYRLFLSPALRNQVTRLQGSP